VGSKKIIKEEKSNRKNFRRHLSVRGITLIRYPFRREEVMGVNTFSPSKGEGEGPVKDPELMAKQQKVGVRIEEIIAREMAKKTAKKIKCGGQWR
jgi:hypothetical protein